MVVDHGKSIFYGIELSFQERNEELEDELEELSKSFK